MEGLAPDGYWNGYDDGRSTGYKEGENRGWNKAVEAAAELARKRVDDHDIAAEILEAILKLKKS